MIKTWAVRFRQLAFGSSGPLRLSEQVCRPLALRANMLCPSYQEDVPPQCSSLTSSIYNRAQLIRSA